MAITSKNEANIVPAFKPEGGLHKHGECVGAPEGACVEHNHPISEMVLLPKRPDLRGMNVINDFHLGPIRYSRHRSRSVGEPSDMVGLVGGGSDDVCRVAIQPPLPSV
jgi:hypothetical protein